MMEINDRIQLTLSDKGITQKALAGKIGVSASTMNNWIKLKRDIPAQYIIPICEFLNISLEYLLTGEECEKTPSPSLTDDEHELLETYKMVGKASQLRILAYALDELENFKNKTTPSNVVK